MFGIDWSGLLAQKYAIMQQQANADTSRASAGLITAQSGANLDNVRAGLMPAESDATRAEQAARTAGITATNKYIGPMALATIGLQKKQGQYYGAAGDNYASEAAGNNLLNGSTSFQDYVNKLRASSGYTPNPGGL